MSKRVYLHLKRGEPAPYELIVWEMAKEFGWTLEYIGSLPLARLHEYQQIIDGREKALHPPKGQKIA